MAAVSGLNTTISNSGVIIAGTLGKTKYTRCAMAMKAVSLTRAGKGTMNSSMN